MIGNRHGRVLTRRALLDGVAAAGGARAVIATLAALGGLPATPTMAAAPALPREARRVLVVGGGIAGLVAAWEMRRAGWAVRLLEAAPRAGGRCMTLRRGDSVQEIDGPVQRVAWPEAPHLYFNPGPARIPHHHGGILGYCRALGVPLEVLVNENRAALVDAPGGPVPLRRVQADLRGLVSELAVKGLGAGGLALPLSEEDLVRLKEALRFWGGLDAELRYRGTSRAGWAEPPGAGLAPPRPNPPLDPRVLMSPAPWLAAGFAEGIDYQATMLQPVGGMDRIAAGFARVLGDVLVTGAGVLALRRVEGGARVTWRGADGAVRQEVAPQVLVALPAPVLAGLDTDLSVERQAALRALHYSGAAKLAFHARRRFWEEDAAIYGGISWTGRDATQLWYPSHGFHAEGGVLTGAYIWDDDVAARFAALAPEARGAVMAADGEALHPGYAAEVAAPVSVAWGRMPRARGAWAEWTAAQRARDYPLLRAPEGPYHFAGEHLSWFIGWQEGAVLSAWNALEGLAKAQG
ncbi:flavin monoamine oxidase family protein [Roseicella aquatilis]|uniref:Tryptophan 2-monooxygenase n=1 Tax=Roseicella aquatilis TaxID=2527868 RepID=A0A4V2WJL9_9PROT|nr:FAD-dependent oxidoreductase [Roseicella aquatilis]TCZ55092.1 FAD-binding protein [Roseicella aquatilis]